MQPDDDKNQWQQPVERDSSVPFVAPTDDTSRGSIDEPMSSTDATNPVVSLSPDITPTPVAQPIVDTNTEIVDDDSPIVHWQAHEYIHREKNSLWYVILGIIVIVFMTVALLLMHSITFAVLIPVMAVALVVYAQRPPHLIDYVLSRQGLHVNDRLYGFAEFKNFAVMHGDDEYSIMLVPIKRFKPGVTIYFPEEKGEAVVDVLASRLPMEEAHIDPIDRLIRKLRI